MDTREWWPGASGRAVGRRLWGDLEEDGEPREGLRGEEGVGKGPGVGMTAPSGDKQAGGW